MSEQLEHIGTVLSVALSAIALIAVFVDWGKKAQKITDTENQVNKHEERIAAAEKGVASLPQIVQSVSRHEQRLTEAERDVASIPDMVEDIDELQGKVEVLESLKTMPATLVQISSQIEKMQITMVAMDRDMRASQSNSAVQAKMIDLIEQQRADFESRMRTVEAALAARGAQPK